ncbi:Cell binding factor 2 precursor [hydrothermal vent metagenome]|uniref:Cell binding factor 2 n=1 Tax=hydrothermal vent metagenome TaxID=652676 RepID=A0A1W1CY02_9ZZZZ
MNKTLLTLGLIFALSTTAIMAKAKTAATVNGIVITIEEADKALDILTKGKKKWSELPEDARKQLIQMMAPSKLVAEASEKALSKKEREAALSGFWMQKKMREIKVTDKDAKVIYDKAVKGAKDPKKVPAFEKVKNDFKMRYAQEKVVAELMKNAKIKVK